MYKISVIEYKLSDKVIIQVICKHHFIINLTEQLFAAEWKIKF